LAKVIVIKARPRIYQRTGRQVGRRLQRTVDLYITKDENMKSYKIVEQLKQESERSLNESTKSNDSPLEHLKGIQKLLKGINLRKLNSERKVKS
jgi:hypothetical protein